MATDDVSTRFFSWAAAKGLKNGEIARMLVISDPNTISAYKSRGLPKNKIARAELLMSEDSQSVEDQQVEDFAHGDQLTIRPSEEEFDAWTAAFKNSPFGTLKEWAVSGLNELAAETSNQRKLPGAPSDLKTVLLNSSPSTPPSNVVSFWIDLHGGVAAGSPIDSVSEEPISVGKQYPDDHYALRVFGSSMEPKIPDGSLIIVKKWGAEKGYPKKGTIVVYSDGSGSTLKEFGYRKAKGDEERDSMGNVPVLRSLNKAFPDVQAMDGGRIDAVYVEAV